MAQTIDEILDRRDRLERLLAAARTRGDEHELGRSLVRIAEELDHAEYRALRGGGDRSTERVGYATYNGLDRAEWDRWRYEDAARARRAAAAGSGAQCPPQFTLATNLTPFTARST